MADKRECPLCIFLHPVDPCDTCDPDDPAVECSHLCVHGAHQAHTGECCYRKKVEGDER